METRSLVSRLAVAAALLMPAPTQTFAGEVYGKVTMGGASVGNGATVAARCGEKAYPAKSTDKSGSYNLIVGETGKCELIITYKGGSASLDMVSNEDAVQYDIDLEMKDGKLAARRR
jgi:hypothetical protein